MGQVFGSTDGLDPSGKQLPQNATADQLGIGTGQLAARRMLQGGLSGLSQGLNSTNMQRRSYSPQINIPQAPLAPKNPFFGG